MSNLLQNHGNEKKPKPEVEVLILGMLRTGTFSLANALEILGIGPCYHGFVLMANARQHSEFWVPALDWKLFNKPFTLPERTADGKPSREFWDKLLGEYGAVSDMPAIIFSEELIRAYPDSKVVLVERDIEKWYTSFEKGLIDNIFNPLTRVLVTIDPFFLSYSHKISSRWVKGCFHDDTKEEMQASSRKVYRDHYAMVRRITPPERLLEFDLKDGWKPLCEFLGKEVPDVPFPHTNDSEALKERIEKWQRDSMGGLLRTGFPIVATIGVATIAYLWS